MSYQENKTTAQLLDSNRAVLSWLLGRLRSTAGDPKRLVLYEELVNLLRAHAAIIADVIAPALAERQPEEAGVLISGAQELQSALADLVSTGTYSIDHPQLLGKVELFLDALGILESQALTTLDRYLDGGDADAVLKAAAELCLAEVAGEVSTRR
jgi:hypothetical protein